MRDSTGYGNRYSIPVSTSLYVNGEEIDGNANRCYLPVFKSTKNDIHWYFGNFFTSYFYMVFDQTPIEEFGKDYIQIGFGPRNPTPLVSEKSKDETAHTGEDVIVVPDVPVPPTPGPDPTPGPGPTPIIKPDNQQS